MTQSKPVVLVCGNVCDEWREAGSKVRRNRRRPERPRARPGLDYLVVMAPSVLFSIGFLLQSHQASTLGAQPGLLED